MFANRVLFGTVSFERLFFNRLAYALPSLKLMLAHLSCWFTASDKRTHAYGCALPPTYIVTTELPDKIFLGTV